MPAHGHLLRGLLPDAVAIAEERGDTTGTELFPAERAVISRACERRRREFATGRACARRALATLGVGPLEIGRGDRGQPLWPVGFVGSITHCDGFRACAVAPSGTLASVGIDAEIDAPLPDRVLNRIAFGPEREMVRSRSGHGPHLDRLLFSAKESVYKAWFQLAGRWLGFADAEVSLAPGGQRFGVRLTVPGPLVRGVELTTMTGRWAAAEGLIVTAVAVP